MCSDDLRLVGPHILTCRSIHALRGFDDMIEKADLIYCDPPWGEGNLKYWATMRRKHTGEYVGQPGLDAFVARFFELCQRHRKGPVIVEYGMAWAAWLISRAHEAGLPHRATAVTYYGSPKRPMVVTLFDDGPAPIGWKQRVSGTSGLTTVKAAMQSFVQPGSTVFDMCCGVGLNARATLGAGGVFIGNEWNPVRLEKTEAVLRANL